MRERTLFVVLWCLALGAGFAAVAGLGRYGLRAVALGLLFAALATAWGWMSSTGLLSFGQAAFFGAGAVAQGWLVTTGGVPPALALPASAATGAVVALPLLPALRLSPAGFALATLAFSIVLKGLAGNVRALGMEGFLLPSSAGFSGGAPLVVGILAVLAPALSLGYEAFLFRPAGRAAAAIRQDPETTSSLGIGLVGERWGAFTLNAAATALLGSIYAHLVGSVEASVVFSPTFSILPLVLGMVGGALHPLGGVVGTLVLYPLDELILRPLLPQAHVLAYGAALLGLLLVKPEGLLPPRIPAIPAGGRPLRASRLPFRLEARGLTVRRNGTVALRDVSFAVEPGQIVRVLGPNGAGKTSLLLTIAGRLRPSAGAVLFDGVVPPRGATARARRGLARTFQAPRSFPEWTVRENIALAAERAGTAPDVDRLLQELDLMDLKERPAGQLSVGEGRRLELARALVQEPSLLLLDEPLAGLTPEAARRASDLIERAAGRGAAVIWVEHGPVAGAPASRLLVLEGGCTRSWGSPP